MPTRLTGIAAVRAFLRFWRDPLDTTIRLQATHGPFVVIADPLPLIKIRKVFALAVGAAFNDEVLSNPGTWGTVIPGPWRGAASVKRLGEGIITLSGRKHAHYRRLLAPPLTRGSIYARGHDVARLVTEQVETWPSGEVVDLYARVRQLVRTLGIGMLFSDDRAHGYPIADQVDRTIERMMSLRVAACPINLPITSYGKMVRECEALERHVLDWADSVRGRPDHHNLLSIIVNSPDENGNPVSSESIVGHIPTLIATTYETCQNALTWTLILLAQHPRIARDLCEELDGKLAGSVPTPDKLEELPLLDAVVKESMRLFPPAPFLHRVAARDTTLAGHAVSKGLHVALCPLLTNRQLDLYRDPYRFWPQRWETISPTPFEYLVFGVGPHSCAGSWFGLSAVKTGLAIILARYRIALLPQAIDYKMRISLGPSGRVLAVLHRKDGAFTPAALRGGITRLVKLASA